MKNLIAGPASSAVVIAATTGTQPCAIGIEQIHITHIVEMVWCENNWLGRMRKHHETTNITSNYR